MQASIIRYLSQARIKWEGCSRKLIQRKNRGWWSWGHWYFGWAGVQMNCQCICLCYLSLHHKIQKMASNNAEVDKGCSVFCVTVGTATRTVSILIYRWLKALAVSLSQPSGWLQLYADLFWSNNPHWLRADLVFCANPSSSSWVWVGECLFWYWLTRVVSDKRPLKGYMCV